MTGHDDDQNVRVPRFEDRLVDRDADALLRGLAVTGEDGLTAFVSELQSLADQPVPAPSRALAALLEDGLVPDTTLLPVLFPVRRKRRWLVSIPLAFVVVGGTVGAASANALPDQAQRLVSDTVSSITPIHLPKPAHRRAPAPARGHAPTPAVSAQPVVPEQHGSDRPGSPRPSASPHGVGDGQSEHGGGEGRDRVRPSASPHPINQGREGGGPGRTSGGSGSGSDVSGSGTDGGHVGDSRSSGDQGGSSSGSGER
ncbi:MAG: hypothetical protein JWM22_197 [Frankiales bacterium]|nr:hypothetical protein [Frankiales bacterium]